MENIETGGVRVEEPAADAVARAEEPAVVASAPPVAVERARGRGLAAVFNSRAALYVAGAIMVGAVFWYLQFSTASVCCGDFDAYYHFRWSRMLWERISAGDFRHFPPAFNALPLTTLNPKDYVDHHLLFHVLQIPFTWFSDMQTGAKVGTWLFACLAVLSCYWLVIRNRLSYPLVWLVAITGSSAPFLYRMNMGKAMSVSIVLLVAGLHLLFERKYKWLLPLAFVFALTYDMFALLVVASVMWAAVVMWTERRVEWEPVVYVVAGSLLGFVVNPYFPHNFQLLYEHLLIKVTAKDFSTAVGSEWYPYTTWEFLGNCGVAYTAMVAGYIAFRDSTKKETQRALLLLLFSTFLMVVNMRWRRFAEYFPPFAVIFAAFAIEPFIRRARERYTSRETSTVGAAEDSGASEASDASDTTEAAARPTPARVENARAWELILVGTAFVLLAAPLVWYARVTSQDIAGMAKPDYYKGGMEWLSKNAEKGELIFNTDWDDFPKLFFYGPDFAYVSGLDPTYLLDKNQKLSELHAKLTIAKDLSDGEVANLGQTIRDNFCVGEGDARRCARYVFTDREHEDFYNDALDSGWFDVAYEDGDCTVFRIREQKGDPVPDNAAPGDDKDNGNDNDGPEDEEGDNDNGQGD